MRPKHTAHVVSASRRTDVPAFYVPWLLRRMDEGEVRFRNPYGGQVHTVSLRPDDVDAWVFWSKNPRPLLEQALAVLRDHYEDRYVLHMSITGLAEGDTRPALEPHVPRTDAACELFLRWADAAGDPRRVCWRLDPVVLTDRTPPERILEAADRIGRRLAGATTTCTFSFVDPYAKVRRSFARLERERGLRVRLPAPEEQARFARALAETLRPHGIEARACCEPALAAVKGVRAASCVDGRLLDALWPERGIRKAKAATREGCGCTVSRDIGAYDTCPHGCAYCYANTDRDRALAALRRHDPASPMLGARR